MPLRTPEEVTVLVEVPRGAFVKREAGRGVDFVSPVPCPFTYGCVPDRAGADGDPVDALVLGVTAGVGARVRVPVWAVVRFRDGGVDDDKLVCAVARPDDGALRRVAVFFRVYARARRVLDLARGRRDGATYLGIERLA